MSRDMGHAVAAPLFKSASESSPPRASTSKRQKGSAGIAAVEIKNAIGRQSHRHLDIAQRGAH